MIFTIPHVTKFGDAWSNLKIQWEVVHLCPARKDGNGGQVYFNLDWLEYIRAMNTPEAFKWMVGDSGTIIWGIKDKKNLANKINKARMPVIAIGGNTIEVVDVKNNYGRVAGLGLIDHDSTPQTLPMYWHRIWCVTKLKHGQVSAPHDTPHGPAYLPILDVRQFRRTKALAAGDLYVRVSEPQANITHSGA